MSEQQRRAADSELRRPAPSAPAEPVSIQEQRAGFAALMAHLGQVPKGWRRGTGTLGGRPVVTVETEGEARPGTILYFHGGSWSLGSPETAIALTANLVVRSGVRAISVDYRLAPEHPFPAAVEDGVAAYRELLSQGTDPASVVFAGDSAGGGLSVTTSLAARAAGLPVPAGIVAFSPGLDATRTGASMDSKAGIDPIFTREGLAPALDLYQGDADAAHELLSPAVHADLTGLPPLLLQVGTNEVLLDDSTRLAERARQFEVDVILDVVAGVPHVFQIFAGRLDEADDALDRAALFITQRLRRR
ncbi:alpha/beta hydrolase [Kineosporia rhizophila]|uniref:alpha/beta hydrolase n=1 Tax=Kineosporia rhizophila TaxID=84633 RepID=UPI001E627854|nr:alpha/beta hydrolase [Kineosporia rhizophila]MCE0538082.1 alpha/beta hydrolase [Kineosporia rhizophila]